MIKVCNYKVEKTGDNSFSIESPCGWFSNTGIFYYGSEDTKNYHKKNLLNDKQGYLPYMQLIGTDSQITNKKVYTRIINARIKGIL